MEEKTLNWLKEQKKYSIILTILLGTTTLLLWKAKWMLYLLWKLKLILWSVFQTELLLIVLILITLITALNISRTRKKLSSQSTKMKQDKIFNKTLEHTITVAHEIFISIFEVSKTKCIAYFCPESSDKFLLMKLILFLLKM